MMIRRTLVEKQTISPGRCALSTSLERLDFSKTFSWRGFAQGLDSANVHEETFSDYNKRRGLTSQTRGFCGADWESTGTIIKDAKERDDWDGWLDVGTGREIVAAEPESTEANATCWLKRSKYGCEFAESNQFCHYRETEHVKYRVCARAGRP